MKEKIVPLKIKYKHIHILGASGSGTTTLGKKLCDNLPFKHFDSDDFFWKEKYSEPNSRDVRLNNLKHGIDLFDNWILSGAVIDWGNSLIPLFDLVIFITVTNKTRLKRLQDREYKRYGNFESPNGQRYEDFLKFMEWADKYETGGMEVRSRYQQKTWLDNLSCTVLELNGDHSIEENYKIVLEQIT